MCLSLREQIDIMLKSCSSPVLSFPMAALLPSKRCLLGYYKNTPKWAILARRCIDWVASTGQRRVFIALWSGQDRHTFETTWLKINCIYYVYFKLPDLPSFSHCLFWSFKFFCIQVMRKPHSGSRALENRARKDSIMC